MRIRKFNRLVPCLAFALLILGLQIYPLSWDRAFYDSWPVHLWLSQYYSDFFRANFDFPSTIDTLQSFGNPMPLFYGVFFYPLSILSTLIFGVDQSLRLMMSAALIVPFIAYVILFYKLLNNLQISILLGLILNTSIYQLTNLYSRSALTEFFAFQMMVLAITLFLIGSISKSKNYIYTYLLSLFCLLSSLGSHPITFYLFCLFVTPFCLFLIVTQKIKITKEKIYYLTFLSVIAILILLPWLITTIKFKKLLSISATSVIYFFPKSIDSFFGKLGLFYVDTRVLEAGVGAVPTPFLDAPFGIALFLTFMLTAYYVAKTSKIDFLKICIPCFLMLVLIGYASITPNNATPGYFINSVYKQAEDGFFFNLLVPIQFIYRLANPFTLCMEIGVIVNIIFLLKAGKITDVNFLENLTRYIWFFGIIALLCLGQKVYLLNIQKPTLQETYGQRAFIANTKEIPSAFSKNDYSMPKLFPMRVGETNQDIHHVSLQPLKEGEIVTFSCEKSCIVNTNISPTPFFKIFVDGQEITNLMISKNENIAFESSKGMHEFYVEKRKSNYFSWARIGIWSYLLLYFFALISLLILCIKGAKIQLKK